MEHMFKKQIKLLIFKSYNLHQNHIKIAYPNLAFSQSSTNYKLMLRIILLILFALFIFAFFLSKIYRLFRQLLMSIKVQQINSSQEQSEDIKINNQLTSDHIWKVIDLYFSKNDLAQQQIDSYNRFIQDISRVILQNGKFQLTINPQFKIGQVIEPEEIWEFAFVSPIYTTQPYHHNADKTVSKVTPMMCRLRDLNYECQIKGDIRFRKYKMGASTRHPQLLKQGLIRQVAIGRIPVMVGSNWCHLKDMTIEEKIAAGECRYDLGGYCIVKGSQKVIVAQQRQACNYIFVFKNNSQIQPWRAQIRSVGSQISSLPATFKLILKYERGFPRVLCKIKGIYKDIPLGLVMRALGILTDRQIFECVCESDLQNVNEQQFQDLKGIMQILRYSLEQVAFVSKDDSLNCLGRFIQNMRMNQSDQVCILSARKILRDKLLPHLGNDDGSLRKKGYFLGYMTKKLISAFLGKVQEDDRDHYAKKRIDLTGKLMLELFTHQFKFAYIDSAQKLIKRKLVDKKKTIQSNIHLIFDERCITNVFRNALATGNWGKNIRGEVIKTGVAQTLKRDTTYFATLSHLRRVSVPVSSTMKSTKPRLLHNTHFGMICPAETPEGIKIGLVKNLALMAKVSLGLTSQKIEQLIQLIKKTQLINLYDVDLDLKIYRGKTKILINGNWIAFTSQPHKLMAFLINKRRTGQISHQVSIVKDMIQKQIKLCTDSGRAMRPLLIVDNNQIKLRANHITSSSTFQSLQKAGFIQYIDVEEEETTLIAMQQSYLMQNTNRYTHCEIHPSMMFGVCASVIPFSNHNQATKNTLQSAMSKQAMGINSTNFDSRMQTLCHLLYYPQRPLVTTKLTKYITVSDLPIGSNPIVAMACFTGYNQQDSLIINQSSVERGLFRSAFYRTYKSQQNLAFNNNSKTVICKPGKDTELDESLINKLDVDGIINPGQLIQNDQIMIGKILMMAENINAIDINQKHKEVCLRAKNQKIITDKVFVTQNAFGNKLVKIKTRSVRIPQIGDKFASRHGQKGTCGMSLRQEDMPFTIDGIVPDFIVNPHCIPSRMTVGHVIECLVGKLVTIQGKFSVDSTPFCQFDMQDKAEQLHSTGYQKYGNQFMQNPYSGKPLDNLIFIGPIYYQRLRHMVDDKMYARSRGMVVALTRQPTHGRARNGGLRFGQMERDSIISHGLSSFLKERLCTVSDKYRIHVCNRCGMMADANIKKDIFICRRCSKSSTIVQVDIPYAAKLLIQQLMSMHIVPKLFCISNEGTVL